MNKLKMKVVSNYKEFLDELEKGNRKIAVTDEFFEWLKTEIGASFVNNRVKPPISTFYGVQVYKASDAKEGE